MKLETFSVRGEIIFGLGAIEELPAKVALRGLKKVLITSDAGLVKAGLVKRVQDLLAGKGIDSAAFTEIEPDPSARTVEQGIKMYVEGGFEGLIGVGGGSAMDVAKGIAIIGNSGKKVADYAGYYIPVDHPVPPIFAVPTTAGTGSEVTRNAVITDYGKYKMVLLNDKILPVVAILDPQLLATLPRSVAAASGADALIHAVECYLCTISTTFSDCMAEKGMELIGPNLRPFVANRGDMDAASKMLLGSALAGISLSLVLPGQAHALSHPITGVYHIPHGIANAVLFPYVLEYNALADKGKYKKIYNLLKPDSSPADKFEPEMLIREIRKLNDDIGIPRTFSELGVKQDIIPELVKDALRTKIYDYVPRQTREEDITQLYVRSIG